MRLALLFCASLTLCCLVSCGPRQVVREYVAVEKPVLCEDPGADVTCGCPGFDFGQHPGSSHNLQVLSCRLRCMNRISDLQRGTIDCYADKADEKAGEGER